MDLIIRATLTSFIQYSIINTFRTSKFTIAHEQTDIGGTFNIEVNNWNKLTAFYCSLCNPCILLAHRISCDLRSLTCPESKQLWEQQQFTAFTLQLVNMIRNSADPCTHNTNPDIPRVQELYPDTMLQQWYQHCRTTSITLLTVLNVGRSYQEGRKLDVRVVCNTESNLLLQSFKTE